MDSFKALLIGPHDGAVSSGFVRVDRRALSANIQGRVQGRAVVEIGGGQDE